MRSQILNRQELPEQAVQPAPTASNTGVLLVPAARDLPGRRSGLPDHRRPHQQVFPGETVTARVDPEEVLIADVRGDLTPAQMVETKLMALLRNVWPGVSRQRTDGPADSRRHVRSGGHPSASRTLDAPLQGDQAE